MNTHYWDLQLIEKAVEEDLTNGDITTETIIDNIKGEGIIIAKEKMVLCGVDLAVAVFKYIDDSLAIVKEKNDGEMLNISDRLIRVKGNVASILKAERIALNFLAKLSGIATTTRKIVESIKNTKTKIYDTRKTTPGWRTLEKYAVRVGGGYNHRKNLSDFILIKDNHKVACGSIKTALEKALSKKGEYIIEVEVENIDELKEILDFPVDIVMLDNFSISEIEEAVKIVKGKFLLEVSGGVTPENVTKIAKLGVDRISMGYLTHSSKWVDISLELKIY